MTTTKKLLVLGVGPMAEEYLQACKANSIEATFVGRSKTGMKRFESRTGIVPIPSLSLAKPENFYGAVIAVTETALSSVLIEVLRAGFRRVLVEKPGGSSISEFPGLHEEVSSYGAEVFVAFNRRFYSTVEKLLQVANKDGGLVSLHFDFTERAAQIASLEKDLKTKEDWFFQNSSHVIDLSLYLAPGLEIHHAEVTGGLPWHPRGSIFSGLGTAAEGVQVSYNTVWGPSGGWEILARTESIKLALKPLETLEVTLPDGTSEVYTEGRLCKLPGKAGLTGMLNAFIERPPRDPRLLSWEGHWGNFHVYRDILNGVSKEC